MSGLKKEEFDEKYRFREARKPGSPGQNLVSCVTCACISGTGEDIFCENKQRGRRVKLRFGSDVGGFHYHLAGQTVCDVYTSRPLPEGVTVPVLAEGQTILLESQWVDSHHADPNCPYVVEEVRVAARGKGEKRAGIRLIDISEKVPGEEIGDICEMPCCETKLPFQLSYNPNGYRQGVGLKPDGTEPKIWVRNGIVKHERKVEMTPEQARDFFDLSKFGSEDSRGIHNRICAAMDYLREGCNILGSRPLEEAANPVSLPPYHYSILECLFRNPQNQLEFWVCNRNLFNMRSLERGEKRVPMRSLGQVPEGVMPCIDTRGIINLGRDLEPSAFLVYGILRQADASLKLPKGVSHFVEIGALDYHHNHYMGVFGKGFREVAAFTEQ